MVRVGIPNPYTTSSAQANVRLEGAQPGKHIEEGSHVRSRVVSKAINQNDPRASKIGLNCKMDGLGAAGWITEND